MKYLCVQNAPAPMQSRSVALGHEITKPGVYCPNRQFRTVRRRRSEIRDELEIVSDLR